MAEENNVMEDVERIEVTPAEGDDYVEDPNATPVEEGAKGGDEGDDANVAGQSKEKLVSHSNHKPASQAGKKPEGEDGDESSETGNGDTGDDAGGTVKEGEDGLKDVPSETPRERALRAELVKMRALRRQDRTDELGLGHGTPATVAPAQRELSQKSKEVLGKYKPAEINALREVIPALAEEMGFVKADDLSQQTYSQQSQSVLDGFLDQHKEYLPENDSDGTLWNAFKTEFSLYQKPANPKDYVKIFNRVHQAIFGIKPAGDKGSLTAAQQKINVASHAGTSGPVRSNQPARSTRGASGLRTDMLKGFSDDEVESIRSRAQGD